MLVDAIGIVRCLVNTKGDSHPYLFMLATHPAYSPKSHAENMDIDANLSQDDLPFIGESNFSGATTKH